MNIFGILLPKHTITYLNSNDRLDKAVEFLMSSGFVAVPVVDDEGKFVGIAREGDFLRIVMEHGRDKLHDFKVEEIIHIDKNDVVLNTVGKEEIMERILDRNFLSVIDDRDCFIGIITRRSILMYLKND